MNMSSISSPVRSSYAGYGRAASGGMAHHKSDAGVSAVQNRTSQINSSGAASGRMMRSMSDAASGASAIQNQTSQINSSGADKRGLSVMANLTNATDIAQSGANDYLQRMNKLSASSASPSAPQSSQENMQQRVDQLKRGMSDVISDSSYKEKQLLDSSNPGLNASNGSGAMASIGTAKSSLETLGFADFSITGKYNSKEIVSTLSALTQKQVKTDMQSSGLEYAYRSQADASYDPAAAQSRTGVGASNDSKAVSDQRMKDAMQQYSNYMQKTNMRMQGDKMVFFE